MAYEYAHMCRDGHLQIGHNDSTDELCPMCHAVSALNHIAELAGRGGPQSAIAALNEIERRAKATLRKLEI